MFRLLVGIVAIVCLLVPLAGCGGDGGDGGDRAASSETATRAPEGQSQQRIPDKVQPPEMVEGVSLSLYFDEAGAETELAVAGGERFSLYVFAEYVDPYHVSAAQFRLDLPEGVSVGSSANFSDIALSMGDPESNLQIGFECRPPGKFYLVRLECVTEAAFSGGKIAITPGVNRAGESYLGFVSCQPEVQLLPTKGSSVTLARK